MQWAQFINPDGDINDANNYIQGPCSLPDWGNGYRHPDYYNGWRQVDDGWVPPVSLDDQKKEKLNSLYQSFCSARDAVVWCNGYGYDAQTEDITNFLMVKNILRDMLVSDPTATLGYKVYKSDGTKEMIPHTMDMFIATQQVGRDQQLTAYARFGDLRSRVATATMQAELEAIQWEA